MRMRVSYGAVASTLIALVLALPAAAATYPSRPIHLIVPYPPGTSTDLTAREIVPKLSSDLGEQIIVDNRGGASGIVGAEEVAHAAPDGYTLLFAASQTQAINLSLYAKLPYNPATDFTPIGRVADVPMVLVASPKLGVHSVAELVALAKKEPGQLNFASSGVGTTAHLCGALLKSDAGIDIVHVPYTSAAQAFSDLMNGEVGLMFYPYLPLSPLIEAHKVVVLATTGTRHPPYLPQAPTMVEAGYKNFVISAWFAIYGPARLPQPIVDKVSAALGQTLRDPEVTKRLIATGNDPAPSDPQDLAKFTQSEIQRYRTVVALSGAKVE